MSAKKETSIRDVAKHAGFSPSTVSRVLRNEGYPVADDTRKKILDAASTLGYFPRGTYTKARQKQKGKMPVIYVIVPSISNPYYSQLITGVEKSLQEKNVRMVLYNTGGSALLETSFVEDIANMSMPCSGVIIASVCTNHDHILQLRYKNIEIVAFDQQIEIDCHKVEMQYHKGGFMATEFFLKAGKSKIGFISSPLTRFSRIQVYNGFLDAHKRYGFQENPDYIKIADSEHAQSNQLYEFANGMTQAKKMIAQSDIPEGVFCINDITAAGAMREFQQAGYRIPEDIGFIGFDNTYISQIITPSLTTIDQDTHNMGVFASDILLGSPKRDHNQTVHITLEPRLIIRDSFR